MNKTKYLYTLVALLALSIFLNAFLAAQPIPKLFFCRSKSSFLTLVPVSAATDTLLILSANSSEEAVLIANFKKYYSAEVVEAPENPLKIAFSTLGTSTIIFANVSSLKSVLYGAYLAGILKKPVVFCREYRVFSQYLAQYSPKKIYLVELSWKTSVEAVYFKKSEAVVDYVLKENLARKFIVVTNLGDEYAVVAPYYAAIKKAVLYVSSDVTKDEKLVELIKRVEPEYVVYIASLKYLKGEKYSTIKDIYGACLKGFDKDYLIPAVSLLSGISIFDVTMLIAKAKLYNLAKGDWKHRVAQIYMYNSWPIAVKMAWLLKMCNYSVVWVSSNFKGTNLTAADVSKVLRESGVLTYINLHGSPYSMAPTTAGPSVITPRTLPLLPPTVVFTLSCSTCDFQELISAEKSIAFSFIRMGALAYIGSLYVELGGAETSTAHPELLLISILKGKTLGEAVKYVLNLHIGERKEKDIAARIHAVLIGDPELKTFPNVNLSLYKFRVLEKNRKFEIVLTKSTTVVFIDEIVVNAKKEDIKKIDIQGQSVLRWIVYEEKGSKTRILVFLSRAFSEMGNIVAGEKFIITIYYKNPMAQYMIVLIILLVALFIAAIILKERMKAKKTRTRSVETGLDRLPCEGDTSAQR